MFRTTVFCLGVSLLAWTGRAAEPTSSFISQDGEGVAEATPDQGRIRAGVISVAETANEAITANASGLAAVRKAIKDLGVDLDRDVKSVRYEISDHYSETSAPNGHTVRRKDGYTVTHTVTVLVRKIADLGKVLDAMVAAGVNDVDAIAPDSSEAAAKKDEARAAAVQDARRRADLIASGLGYRVGSVLEVSESSMGRSLGSRIESAMMSPMSARSAAPTEISGGTLEYHARVSVRWSLVKADPSP